MVALAPPDLGVISRLDKANRSPAVEYELNFAGDTYISIDLTGETFDIDDFELEYEFENAVPPTWASGGLRYTWAAKVSGDATYLSWNALRNDANNFRISIRASSTTDWQQFHEQLDPGNNTPCWMRQTKDAATNVSSEGGNITANVRQNEWTDSGNHPGGAGNLDTLVIGYNPDNTSDGFHGVIKKFKIRNAGGTLIHDWKIDDNSTTIVDSAGTSNGTLTIGSGSWSTATWSTAD